MVTHFTPRIITRMGGWSVKYKGADGRIHDKFFTDEIIRDQFIQQQYIKNYDGDRSGYYH